MRKFFFIIIYLFAFVGFTLSTVYIAVELGLTKSKGIIDNQRNYFKNEAKITQTEAWVDSKEWFVLKQAIKKDNGTIIKVSDETGIPAKIIVLPLIVEQLRIFTSEREIFKDIFSPLKILANQSQFSWGVMGIKQETAIKIEENLKDRNSVWYLGEDFENILDFKTSDIGKERFEKLTDENDRYFSYLYGALYIKQLEKQWSDADFPITDKPGVIATLYNIGFKNSKPKNNPQVGGAEIEINKATYSFGGLAQSIFYSGELDDIF